MINNPGIYNEISELVEKYFTEKIKSPQKCSNTIYIRSVMSQRINEYFSKSLLNEILLKKGFKYQINDDTDYYFNISQKDIQILGNSSIVLKTISEKDNYPLSSYVKLLKLRNIELYKYTFKCIIKCKFKSIFFEKILTENAVYSVLAKELGISDFLVKKYIETFNLSDFPEMPDDILQKLLKIFGIKREECFTNEIDFCRVSI